MQKIVFKIIPANQFSLAVFGLEENNPMTETSTIPSRPPQTQKYPAEEKRFSLNLDFHRKVSHWHSSNPKISQPATKCKKGSFSLQARSDYFVVCKICPHFLELNSFLSLPNDLSAWLHQKLYPHYLTTEVEISCKLFTIQITVRKKRVKSFDLQKTSSEFLLFFLFTRRVGIHKLDLIPNTVCW